MTLRRSFRFLQIAVAALAVFGGPGAAIAHGMAHDRAVHDAVHHADDHHRTGPALSGQAQGGATVAAHSQDDHSHAGVDAGPTVKRVEWSGAPVGLPAEVGAGSFGSAGHVIQQLNAVRARAAPPQAPPPPSRAPPIG